jgi:TfoX/Sxy family transcriptional regulator of competence genes
MAYDEGLAQRIEEVLSEQPEFVAKKMFGGVGYMLRGNMACGVNQDNLIVRVGADNYETAMAQDHTAAFDMTGRAMKGWVVVLPEGYEGDRDLEAWVQKGVDFCLSLPAK